MAFGITKTFDGGTPARKTQNAPLLPFHCLQCRYHKKLLPSPIDWLKNIFLLLISLQSTATQSEEIKNK